MMRNNTKKDQLINRIIQTEWMMFDRVENQGGRAACQDDAWTFYAMRYSQHNAFSEATLTSYEQDLQTAQQEGRNLLFEKYAYMMEYTDPAYFKEKLRLVLPAVSEEKAALVEEIAELSVEFQLEFEQNYPYFAKAGRPVTGTEGSQVSLNVYAIGELKTYSVNTLKLYLQDMQQSRRSGINTAFLIHRSTAEFYGYESIEAAEERLKNQ